MGVGGPFAPMTVALSLAGVGLTAATQLTFDYDPTLLRLWRSDRGTDGSPPPAGDLIEPGAALAAGALSGSQVFVQAVLGAAGSSAVPVTVTAQVSGARFSGVLQDRVHVKPIDVDLVAHRTGGKFGEAVSASVEDEGEPAKYLVLTNNDFEEGSSDGGRDYDNDTAAVPSDPSAAGPDDDLARITLKGLAAGLTAGSFAVGLSNPAAVRLFKADGTALAPSDLSLDLSAPAGGYLAPLASGGDVDLWLEGLGKDSDFVLSLAYADPAGRAVARDDVHIGLIDITASVQGTTDFPGIIPALTKPDLLAAAAGTAGMVDARFLEVFGTYLAESKFRLTYGGLTPASDARVVLRNAVTSEANDEGLDYSAGDASSHEDSVLYDAAGSSDALTLAEWHQIADNLQVNAIANGDVKAVLSTGFDELPWQLPAVSHDHQSVAFVDSTVTEVPDFSTFGSPFSFESGDAPDTDGDGNPGGAGGSGSQSAASAGAAAATGLTQEQVVTYLKVMYGTKGEQLLEAFQNATKADGTPQGHEIVIYDDWFDNDNSAISDALWSVGTKIKIWIGDHLDPAHGAEELYKHLLTARGRQSSGINNYILDHYKPQDIDPDQWVASYQAAFDDAKATVASVADAYFQGMQKR